MKVLRFVLLSCILVCFGAAVAFAEPIGRPDTPTLLNKVNGYTFLVDMSGSMMMTSSDLAAQKIVVAKKVMGAINDRMPTLKYDAALATLCPVATSVASTSWDRETYGKAISVLPTDLEIWGRLTPLGTAITNAKPSFAASDAVILVSDGYKNIGPDTLDAFKAALAGKQLHIISLADTAEGKATIAKLAALDSNTVCVNAQDLAYNPVAVDNFIAKVFYVEGPTAVMESVYFDTGKYVLKAEAMAILDKCVTTILSTPRGVRTVEIEGFADAQGGYSVSNQILSENRARAVAQYLESKGVPTSKVWFNGDNVSHKYNNKTKDGRRDNRRTDLVIN